MTYFPHSEKDIKEMLEATGKKNLEDFTSPIPDKYKIKKNNSEEGLTELEVEKYFEKIGAKNKKYSSIFLGAGAYDHYIPSAVNEITGRQEFYTAYTPYQAEVSQGTLQGIFEYQTYVANITGMDVSNASMYDGATSCAEAIVIALGVTRQRKVLVDKYLHPEYIEVIKTYMKPIGVEVELFGSDPFELDINKFNKTWSSDYAAFVLSSPNFCGSIIDYSNIVDVIHNDKRLVIHAVSEMMSLSILKSPGEIGADIACGEMQSFGIPLSFGGPYLGFLSCKKEFLRKMPGRIVGQTKDVAGNIVYTLTLTAREQHIRRELATSNICSNHGLCAMMSSVYLSTLGANGLKSCGLSNIENAYYLRDKITEIKNFSIIKNQVFFNEFIVTATIDKEIIITALENEGILSFYPLEKIDDSLKNCYLVCATEKNDKIEMDNFIEVLRRIK